MVAKVKFDETNQEVQYGIDIDVDGHVVHTDGIPLKVPTMVRRLGFYTPEFGASPLTFILPILFLENTRSHCLFEAIVKDLLFEARDDVTRWCLFALLMINCDSASSNQRMVSWQVRNRSPMTLVLAIYCVQHIIHNSVKPSLQVYNFTGTLYRAHNLFRYNSFYAKAIAVCIHELKRMSYVSRTEIHEHVEHVTNASLRSCSAMANHVSI